MTPLKVDVGDGTLFWICTVCGGPCESVDPVPGGKNFVPDHRPNPWRGIVGHRRHAVCCAEATRRGS